MTPRGFDVSRNTPSARPLPLFVTPPRPGPKQTDAIVKFGPDATFGDSVITQQKNLGVIWRKQNDHSCSSISRAIASFTPVRSKAPSFLLLPSPVKRKLAGPVKEWNRLLLGKQLYWVTAQHSTDVLLTVIPTFHWQRGTFHPDLFLLVL